MPGFIYCPELKLRSRRLYNQYIICAAVLQILASFDCQLVQAYEVVPPTIAHCWCAHFAECIVKPHHKGIASQEKLDEFTVAKSSEIWKIFVGKSGYSSPHLPIATIKDPLHPLSIFHLSNDMNNHDVLASQALADGLAFSWPRIDGENINLAENNEDPSTYVPTRHRKLFRGQISTGTISAYICEIWDILFSKRSREDCANICCSAR